jgi:hypothetical protein
MSEHKCLTCKHAVWRKTKAGRLHPDGDGKCMYIVPIPALPAAMWWGYWGRVDPSISGGAISRRPFNQGLYSECLTWAPLVLARAAGRKEIE